MLILLPLLELVGYRAEFFNSILDFCIATWGGELKSRLLQRPTSGVARSAKIA